MAYKIDFWLKQNSPTEVEEKWRDLRGGRGCCRSTCCRANSSSRSHGRRSSRDTRRCDWSL